MDQVDCIVGVLTKNVECGKIPISTEEEEALARRIAQAGFSTPEPEIRPSELFFCMNANQSTNEKQHHTHKSTATETNDCFPTLSWSWGGSTMVDADGTCADEGSGGGF